MFGRNKKEKAGNDTEKNKKLTGDEIRLRIYRLINNSPVESYVMMAQLIRDSSNNSIIFNEDFNVKEELAGIRDPLVSDILYKLENRNLDKEGQIEKVKEAIKKQDAIVKNEKDGYLVKTTSKIIDGKTVEVEEKVKKINILTEKSKLNLLKCVKYSLINLKGEGFYETIEADGTRSLRYLLIDGNLFPYWYKMPTDDGEPVILAPDVVSRKKLYKEFSEESINDFRESQDFMWKGILGVILKALTVLMFAGLLFWTYHNYQWTQENSEQTYTEEFNKLQLENERIKQMCNSNIAQYMNNHGIIIDYAKLKMEEDKQQSKLTANAQDKANIQI